MRREAGGTAKAGRGVEVILLAVAILAAVVAGTEGMATAAISIRFNHTFGPGSSADLAVKRFAEEVAKKSGNRIQVKVFSAGELGQEREQYDLLQTGAIEMALAGLLVPAVAPEYGVVDMPYLWRDQEHLRKVLDGPIGQELQAKMLQRKGIRNLAFINRGPRNLTTKTRPVRVPADLQGMKIRTLQNPVHIEAWKMLGASPVPMAIGEVFVGLQQGTVEAQENPVEMIKAMSFAEVQKYLIRTAHVRGFIWVVVSDRFWKTLSPEDQRLLETEAKAAAAFGDRLQQEQDTAIEKELQAKGMIIIDPDVAEFRKALAGLPAKFSKEWMPGLYERIVNAH